jgi:hypothetical protein
MASDNRVVASDTPTYSLRTHGDRLEEGMHLRRTRPRMGSVPRTVPRRSTSKRGGRPDGVLRPLRQTSPDAASGGQWIQRAAFSWACPDSEITVQAGFDTVATSVPRLLWWWQPPIGGMAYRASLPHDYLYLRVGCCGNTKARVARAARAFLRSLPG